MGILLWADLTWHGQPTCFGRKGQGLRWPCPIRSALKRIYVTGQNRSPFIANNALEHYWKRIEILHGNPSKSWPYRARQCHPFRQMAWDGHALLGQPSKGHFAGFFHNVLLHYWQHISKNWRFICPVHISGLLHSVNRQDVSTTKLELLLILFIEFGHSSS